MKITATVWKNWNVKNLMHGSKQYFLTWIVFHEKKVYDRAHGWRIIPSVSEKYELENRNKSILSNICWFFLLSGLWRKDQKLLFYYRFVFHKCQPFDWHLDGRSQVYSCGETRVSISIKIFTSSIFQNIITIRIPTQGLKSILPQWCSSPRVLGVRSTPGLEKQTCFVLKKLSTMYFCMNRTFWQYLNVEIVDRCDAADIFGAINRVETNDS